MSEKKKDFFLSLLNSALMLLIFIGTIIPLSSPFLKLNWSKASDMLSRQDHLLLIILAFITLLVTGMYILYFMLKKFYRVELEHTKFYKLLGFIFIIFIIIKLIYVFNYEQNFHSDFRTMWNYALETYHLGEFIPPDRPQSQRPLASLVPLVYLFGTSETVFKLANIFFIMSTGLMIALITAKLVSRHAGLLLFLVIMLTPELYFASLIPTHDIAGSFYMVLYLFTIFQFIKQYKTIPLYKVLVYIVMLSAVGLLLDVQRGIFIVLIVSLLFYSIILAINEENLPNFKKILWVSSLVIILPYVFEQFVLSSLKKNDILVSDERTTLFFKHNMPIRFAHSFSDGDYYTGAALWDNYADSIQEKNMIYIKKALPLSDLYYNVQERPMNYVERASKLYKLGSSAGFYYGNLKHMSKDENDKIVKINNVLNSVFSMVFILLMIISSLYLLINKYDEKKKIIFFPLIFMSIFTMALLLVGEVQPRYLFIGWFLWPMVIVWFFDSLFIKTSLYHKEEAVLPWNVKSMIIVFVIVFSFYGLFRVVFTDSAYKLMDMKTWNEVTCNQALKKSCKKSIVHFENTLDDKQFSTLKLQFPAAVKKDDYIRVSKEFNVDQHKLYSLNFYTLSPNLKNEYPIAYFDINIYVDDTLRKSLKQVVSEKYKFININNIMPQNKKIKISLEVIAKHDAPNESLGKTSLVHFKFMSLREESL